MEVRSTSKDADQANIFFKITKSHALPLENLNTKLWWPWLYNGGERSFRCLHRRSEAFCMPLSYLNSNILRELFKMSEEEFQVSSDGPITLSCDANFMEYDLTLIQRGAAEDILKALLKSISCSSCSLSSAYHHQGFPSQPSLVYGY
ncbi:hypothetical protein FNV43_RR21900 [Rhamnella rubrinervis]|uniref:Uncharacterized protein n=1 Tax=Rhamnella rubrinervis TaxID=2594499 RepID=A0A8K0GQJ9_9ROSA|nr:hypothetical protein FNV43_RR21900 [Rhamnella rubrinervis]